MVSVTSAPLQPSCSFNSPYLLGSDCRTCVSLLEVGGKLLEQGKFEEALIMFDVTSHSINVKHLDFSANLRWGQQHLVNKTIEKASPEHVDMYQEDECDVGPRPFAKPLLCDETTPTDIFQLAIWYNQALALHFKKEEKRALQLYSVIIGSINMTHSADVPSVEKLHIAMRALNNMGCLCYIEDAEESAGLHFEQATLLAKRVSEGTTEHLLDYATIVSNWCRVQWMIGCISGDLYKALEEIHAIRSGILGSSHIDVASSHYNMGIAEYSRHQNDAAMIHFMQYLSFSSKRIKTGKRDLDPISALTYVILIKNENNEDKTSQDLVWGLQALQEKRHELGVYNSEVASVLNFIGTLLFHQRELEYALLFFQEELCVEEHLILQGEDVSVNVTCNNIGRLLQELGRFHDAIHYYKRSLQFKFGDSVEDPDVSKGKFRPSSLPIKGCYDESDLPSSSMNLYSTVWYNLGLIHDKMGSYIEAIKAFQMSLKLRREMLGLNHADVACLLYNIGVLQMEQQMLNNATDSFREALRIRRIASTGQLNDRHVVKTLQKLTSLHKAKGNIRCALEACDEVMHVLHISSDFDFSSRAKHLSSTLRDKAELHYAHGDLKVARKAAFESLKIVRSIISDDKSSLIVQSSTIEQEVSILLLIGSLQHEENESFSAYRCFTEAAVLIRDFALKCNSPDKSIIFSRLLPLYEVSTMLASPHCAPEA